MGMPRHGSTGAEAVAEALRAAGVHRLYGVPGGGSSLDLVEAAAARGIPFVLARQETAAVIMAATEAELSGRPGAVVVTRGPGVGNAANGMAQASLEETAFPERLHLSALSLRLQLEQELAVLRWTRWARDQVAQWESTTDPAAWSAPDSLGELVASARAALAEHSRG